MKRWQIRKKCRLRLMVSSLNRSGCILWLKSWYGGGIGRKVNSHCRLQRKRHSRKLPTTPEASREALRGEQRRGKSNTATSFATTMQMSGSLSMTCSKNLQVKSTPSALKCLCGKRIHSPCSLACKARTTSRFEPLTKKRMYNTLM